MKTTLLDLDNNFYQLGVLKRDLLLEQKEYLQSQYEFQNGNRVIYSLKQIFKENEVKKISKTPLSLVHKFPYLRKIRQPSSTLLFLYSQYEKL